MLINNNPGTVSGYINHEGEVVSDIQEHHSGIINHRRTTRQRHLSSGQDENIASTYFAAQYGGQPQQCERSQQSQQAGSKAASGHGSRRGSMGGAGAGLRACDQSVSQVMATAAALIAAKKAKEKEAAMRAEQTEREQRRQLQQREMTPDNARIVEQKLLEFQKQQEETAHENVSVQGTVTEYQHQKHQEQVHYQQQAVQYHQQEVQYQQQESQYQQQQHTEQKSFNSSFHHQEQQFMQQESSMSHQHYTQNMVQQQQVSQQTMVQQTTQQNMVQQHHQQTTQQNMVQQQHHQMSQQNIVQHQQMTEQNMVEQMTEQNVLQHQRYAQVENTVQQQYSTQQHIMSEQSMDQQQNGPVYLTNGIQEQQQYAESNNSQNYSNGTDQNYLPSMPSDGSMPYRTNPIGEPVTKRSQSVAATPDREVKRKWSISASTDYLNKTSKDNYMARNNPIGLAEPSVKRDGYAVGSREGSMYRSSGNLNVSSGSQRSRAGSEVKDGPPGGWQSGRRASTSDIKGSGIRTGGNMVEPSVKTQNFCMPFGSAKAKGNFVQKKTKQVVNQSAQQITENKLQAKRGSSSQVTTTVHQESHSSSSMTQHSQQTTQYQVGSALSGITSALEQIEVNDTKQSVTMPMPRKGRRAQSLPRGQVSNEQSSFTLSRPGSTRTSRQASVEPEQNRKALSRHGSVEIFDGAYNLTVPNKLSRHASTTKLEEIHSDHIKIVGELENEEEKGVVINRDQSNDINDNKSSFSDIKSTASSSSVASNQTKESQESSSALSSQSQGYAASSMSQQSMSSSTSLTSMTSMQRSETMSETRSVSQQQSSVETLQQSTIQKQRSRHASNTQDTVVSSGGKFNISTGLKRQSTEDVRRSRHVSGSVEASNGAGSALKGLDSALEKIAAAQRKEETTYVGKVTSTSSRATSKRGSVSAASEDVTNVVVSLPASKQNSRATSRRNSIDLGNKGRRSRRGSVDIYAAEYEIKMDKKKNISELKQTTSLHLKLEDDSALDKHELFKQRRDAIETDGWEPYQEWFYDSEFRTWWQVMGCTGVPLYKIYQRKTQWRTERPPEAPEEADTSSGLVRNDSVDDMIAQVLKQRQVREARAAARAAAAEAGDSSGRSTPEHLRGVNTEADDSNEEEVNNKKNTAKTRTFSETLKMLDDDILADLDVK